MMKCAICGIEIESTEKAIDEGWIPYFYEVDKEHGPLCSSCAEKLICMGEDGECELKQEYRGKITYKEGDFFDEEPQEHKSIGIVLEYCDN